MKKKNKPLVEKLMPVRFYLDDIEEIIGIFDSEGFKDVEIITNDNIYTKDEVRKITQDQKIESIQSYEPFHVTVSFNEVLGKGVRIYSGTSSTLAVGILSKLKDVVNKRKRKIFSVVSNTGIWSWFFTIGFFLTMFVMDSKLLVNLIPVLSGGLMFMLSFLFDAGFFGKNKFIYEKKSSKPSFWKREKDNLITGIVVAIITFFLTLFFQNIF